jgi:hypothetical protein
MASKPAKTAHSTARVANPVDRRSRATTTQHGPPTFGEVFDPEE